MVFVGNPSRVTSISAVTPTGSGNAALAYTYTLTGQVLSESNGTDTTTYTYDALDRVLTETDGSNVRTYTYDIGDNRTSFVLTVGGSQQLNTSYTYDEAERLAGVTNGSVTAAYGYDANGNRSYVQYNNGLRESYTYNKANLLTSLVNKNSAGSVLSQYDYTYQLDGNQLSKTDANGKVTSYTYDDLGRLVSESESVSGAVTQTYTYAYDDRSNRTGLTATGADAYTTSYTYDLNNRLLTESRGGVTTTYTYDANGNQLTKSSSAVAEAVTNQYNGLGQLVGVTAGTNAVTYGYAPSGLRTSKTVGVVTTDYILDGDNVVLEMQGTAVTGKYIRGFELICAEQGSTTRYYLYNGHGDVVQLTDATGAVTKSYEYDAFGNEKNPDTNDTNPFRYCGEYFDVETGTYYLRARYYDPALGRFTSEDPHWNTGTMVYGDEPMKLNEYTYAPDISAIIQSGNRYVYVINNPVLYVDKDGDIIVLAIVAGAIIGGIINAGTNV